MPDRSFSGAHQAWAARIKKDIGQRHQSGDNDSKAGLRKGDQSFGKVNESQKTFQHTTPNSDFDPDDVPNGIHGGNDIAGTHRGEHAAPKTDDVTDSLRQVLELKGRFYLSRHKDKGRAEQEQHRRIQ